MELWEDEGSQSQKVKPTPCVTGPVLLGVSHHLLRLKTTIFSAWRHVASVKTSMDVASDRRCLVRSLNFRIVNACKEAKTGNLVWCTARVFLRNYGRDSDVCPNGSN